MTVYQRKTSQPFKWMLAIILFILAMTVTFNDVSGFNLPNNGSAQDTMTVDNNSGIGDVASGGDVGPSSSPPAPSMIPEPATIILLASGLGVMYAMRRKKS